MFASSVCIMITDKEKSLQLACLQALKDMVTVDGIMKEIMHNSIEAIFHHVYDMTKDIVDRIGITDETIYETFMIEGCKKSLQHVVNVNP